MSKVWFVVTVTLGFPEWEQRGQDCGRCHDRLSKFTRFLTSRMLSGTNSFLFHLPRPSFTVLVAREGIFVRHQEFPGCGRHHCASQRRHCSNDLSMSHHPTTSAMHTRSRFLSSPSQAWAQVPSRWYWYCKDYTLADTARCRGRSSLPTGGLLTEHRQQPQGSAMHHMGMSHKMRP